MNFFGIDGSELLLLLVIAMVIVGPVRGAQAIIWLQDGLKKLREYSAQLREQSNVATNEVGQLARELKASELTNLNLAQLNPKQLIKETVAEEMQAWIKQIQMPTGEQSATLSVPKKEQSGETIKYEEKNSQNPKISEEPTGHNEGE